MKKFICGILVGSLCTLTIGTLASGVWDNISVLRNDIKVVVDGTEVTADNFLYNDTTYLPIRAIGTALGENVEYDEQTNTAYIGERTDNLDNTEIKSKYIPDAQIYDPGNRFGASDMNNDYFFTPLVDGEYYIWTGVFRSNFKGDVDYNIDDAQMILTFPNGNKQSYDIVVVNGHDYIKYDDFVDEILPFVEFD